MESGKIILDAPRFSLMLERLCHQLLEEYGNFEGCCLVGIQPRGVLLSDRIHHKLLNLSGLSKIEYGKLDITFYRDDFRTENHPLTPYPNEMDFVVAQKRVLLIDDVLYTGRTIQAALAALAHYGRPKEVELLTLVDRRFNRQIPIQPDFVGITVDALDEAYVKVHWEEAQGSDEILLFDKKVPA